MQPFLALGKALAAASYYHKVRTGTHPVFRDLVRENGLDFYSIGGDPVKLTSYMVRNPGILPSLESSKAGDIGKRKSELEEMLKKAWRARKEAGGVLTSNEPGTCLWQTGSLYEGPHPYFNQVPHDEIYACNGSIQYGDHRAVYQNLGASLGVGCARSCALQQFSGVLFGALR